MNVTAPSPNRIKNSAIRDSRDQAVSLWRPLRRRLFTISRPARVDIRERKPCFLARFRTFGWYVRFIHLLRIKWVTNNACPAEIARVSKWDALAVV